MEGNTLDKAEPKKERYLSTKKSRASEKAISLITINSLLAIKRRFANVQDAFLLLAGILIALVTIYTVISVMLRPTSLESAKDDLGKMVYWSQIGYLEPEYDPALERKFPRTKIQEVKNYVSDYLDGEGGQRGARRIAFEQRVEALKTAASAICATDGTEYVSPPSVLARLGAGEAGRIKVPLGLESDNAIEVSCGASWRVTAAAAPSVNEISFR